MAAGALAEQAGQACAEKRCEAAIDLLERAVREQPADLNLYYALGLCYAGACGSPHPLVSPELAIPCLRRALELLGGQADDAPRGLCLDALGSALARSRGGSQFAAIRESIECHREAAAVYERIGRLDDWARTQFNLGNSWCELSEIAGENHWQEAVACYESSLRVRTRAKDPDRHAAVLENLGGAYRRLPGDAVANVKKSIVCYRQALRIFTHSRDPARNAALQNNLGNAYLSLPETGADGARNARRALRRLDRALKVRAARPESRDFAVTEYNRAQAYFRLARSGSPADLSSAMECLAKACAAFRACGDERHERIACAQLERMREN